MCIVINLKYIITVCYDVIILYNFLPMHSFFFPLVYKYIIAYRCQIGVVARLSPLVSGMGSGEGNRSGDRDLPKWYPANKFTF